MMVFGTAKKSLLPVVTVSLLTVGFTLYFDWTWPASGETGNKTKEIARVLERAVEYGAKMENEYFRAKLFHHIAAVEVEIGNLMGALEIANRKDNVFRHRTLEAICLKQLELGQIEEGLNTVGMFKAGHWRAMTLQRIAQKLVELQKIEAALKIISQAIQTALTEVKFTWPTMKADVMLSIAETQWEAKDKKGARQTIQKAIQIAMGDEDSFRRAIFFENASVLQARLGDMESALATVKSIPIDLVRPVAMKGISGAQAKSGDIPGALKTAATIENRWHRDGAFLSITEIQAHTRDIPGALETTTFIKYRKRTKTLAYLRIAKAQLKVPDLKAGSHTLAKAYKLARDIRGPYERGGTLSAIASIQAEIGDTKGAEGSITVALQAIPSIKNTSWRNEVLHAIAEAQAKAGDILGSMKTVESLDFDFRKERAYYQIAKAQALTINFNEALQTAAKSQGEEFMWRAFTLQLIARIQAHHSQEKEAVDWATKQNVPSDSAFSFLGIAEGIASQGKVLDEGWPTSLHW